MNSNINDVSHINCQEKEKLKAKKQQQALLDDNSRKQIKTLEEYQVAKRSKERDTVVRRKLEEQPEYLNCVVTQVAARRLLIGWLLFLIGVGILDAWFVLPELVPPLTETVCTVAGTQPSAPWYIASAIILEVGIVGLCFLAKLFVPSPLAAWNALTNISVEDANDPKELRRKQVQHSRAYRQFWASAITCGLYLLFLGWILLVNWKVGGDQVEIMNLLRDSQSTEVSAEDLMREAGEWEETKTEYPSSATDSEDSSSGMSRYLTPKTTILAVIWVLHLSLLMIPAFGHGPLDEARNSPAKVERRIKVAVNTMDVAALKIDKLLEKSSRDEIVFEAARAATPESVILHINELFGREKWKPANDTRRSNISVAV